MSQNLNLAMIGNSTINALVTPQADIVWCCYPQPDGDPVFCRLLDGGANACAPDEGVFSIVIDNFSHSEQSYLKNSAVLRTVLYDTQGQAVEILDFCPRFESLDRMHRPASIFRMLSPLRGTPRIAVCLKPRFHYGALSPNLTRGSNHLRFVGPEYTLRLTSDAPLSYITNQTPFLLENPIHLLLTADESLISSIADTARSFLNQTLHYWREFVRYLALPFEWQEEIIRAAITLKLCSYEETGAIIAAATTSIPEDKSSTRNWDYRYCWLRDSYFVVHALNRLGATRTMEEYLSYIANIVADSQDGYLQPMFTIGLDSHRRAEIDVPLSGYRGQGPVRCGNHAFGQVQNDSYGAVILASAQMFFDRRLCHPGDHNLFERLEILGKKARLLWDQPDAGLWELRTRQSVHSFSAVMCWAACDRLGRIARHIGLEDRAKFWQEEAQNIHRHIMQRAFNTELNSFVDCFEGQNLDASLLLLAELGFIPAQDPKYLGTVAAVEKYLKKGQYIQRYHAEDDFGAPEVSFTICNFWYVDALANIGRYDEARALFEHLLSIRNHVGLLSEDIDPTNGELWGNFPQTYSLVGLINSALKLSISWEEVL